VTRGALDAGKYDCARSKYREVKRSWQKQVVSYANAITATMIAICECAMGESEGCRSV
jgi:hypothetical protein